MRVIELTVSAVSAGACNAVAFWRRSLSLPLLPGVAAPSGPTIVLIGGDKQGYPRTEHDYPDGILAIERLIKGSPQLQALNPVIKSFPAGFPSDLSQIADADVVLLYFGMDYAAR